ncbi:Signal transduction histidine kinase [Streptomyces sp. SceaMP-e96]|uniref:sensor histidine kinase n=1 Tax=unclassified Streptomyces TaxID=2593676 RepID=UPI000823B187|nr:MULTISPECIES: sensor histidine kinase [unclassified Streptomyces]MYT12744.1 sensor histidine kinase [Streptomyces sp. SID4951]SCK38343.1 Signal transduction histidine kinase [Streptomyces sp. SceaMP-e96]
MTGRSSTPEPEPAHGPVREPGRQRALRAARQALRVLAVELGTPTEPGTPLLGSVRSPWLRHLPYVVAFGFAVSLLPTTINVLSHDYGLDGGLSGALATAQTVPLLLAVTRPLQAWWVIFAADVIGALALTGADGVADRAWPWPPTGIVGYLALMLALSLRERRRTLTAVWLTTGVAGLLSQVFAPDGSKSTWVLMFVLTGVVLMMGATLRERGDAQRKLIEQETISEAERARRTLLEERARIARELHDVVAHHMSVITVQAASAPYRISGIPREAEEEFGSIAATARESLAEMRRLLGVLRSEEAVRHDGPEKTPQPGIAMLPKLVEGTVRAGVPVKLALPEEPVALEPAVDLSAYRIVQEALANVVRHAPGAPTRVSVTPAADGARLTVLVVNSAPSAPSAPLETTGTGHGLIGMRERVRLVDGSLDTGPLPDGGFRVAAQLPLPPPPHPASSLSAKDSHPA